MALKAGYIGVKRRIYEKLQATIIKNVQDISNIRSEQAALGARNLNATDYTKSSALTNIVPTFNSDGSITVNGTTTAAETLAGGSGANFTAWYGGKVRIADAPADVTMALYDATAGANAGTAGQTVTMIAGHAYRLSITFAANKTFTNVTVNPLIVIASDPTNEPSPYVMTNLQLMNNQFNRNVVLTSSDDLNDIKDSGIYGVTSAPTNSPEGNSYYTLIVQRTGAQDVRQLIFRGGSTAAIYTRNWSTTWSNWIKFTGTAVTPANTAVNPETRSESNGTEIDDQPEIEEQPVDEVKKTTKSTKKSATK